MIRAGFEHMAAVTAIALTMPLCALAQGTGTVDSGKYAAVPNAAAPVQASQDASPPASQSEGTPVSPTSVSPAPAAEPAPATNAPAAATERKPDPLAALDPADHPIAEKLRDLIAAKSDRIFAAKKERAAVEAFYQARNFAPLWLDKGMQNARAKAVIARLKNADEDGLEPGDYRTPNLAAPESALDLVAEAELKLTAAVLTYARHVQAGRFPYGRLSHNIELPQAPPDTGEVLSRIATANDAAKALDELSPQHEPYRRLKAMLAQMRGKSGGASERDLRGAGAQLQPQKPGGRSARPALARKAQAHRRCLRSQI